MDIGFLGAGSIAERHIDAIHRTGAGRVVALASRTSERATTLAAKKGISRATSDTASILHDPDIAVVVIAYPTFLHASLAIEALRSGKHVVVEKPIAETTDEAQAMIEAAASAERQLLVCQLRRFWPTYAGIKQFVSDGEAGAPHRLMFDFQADWNWQNRGWRIARPGGYFLDMHVHEIDLLSWWAGVSPTAITGMGTNMADREGIVALRYPHAVGSVSFSGRVPGKPYPVGSTSQIHVVCERGAVDVSVAGGDVTLRRQIGDAVTTSRRSIAEETSASWDRMWSAFGQAITGAAPAPLTPQEAAASLASTLAAVDAMRGAQTIVLPQPPVVYS